MKEHDAHATTKHPRGSSPPDNVEQIYRNWLQRLPVLREGPAVVEPRTDVPEAKPEQEKEKE